MTRPVSRVAGKQWDPRWRALVALYRAARKEPRRGDRNFHHHNEGETMSYPEKGAKYADERKTPGFVRNAIAEENQKPTGRHHMTAGAATGVGRLEKIGKKPHDAGKPQEV